MTTKANQTKINTIKICEATKKNGDPCKFKAQPNSCFCGVHKNFIDTSKSLFTEDIEEVEKLTLNFMTGDNIKINKGYTIDYILQIISLKYPLDNYKYKYNIFKEGEEDKITDNTYKFNDENYFCMPSQKFTYEEGDYIYSYMKVEYEDMIHQKCISELSKITPNEFLKNNDGFINAGYFKIVKRTKYFIMVKKKYGMAMCKYGEGNVVIEEKYDSLFEDLNYNYKTNKLRITTDADGNESCTGFFLNAEDFKRE
jgi:hypothetical protein